LTECAALLVVLLGAKSNRKRKQRALLTFQAPQLLFQSTQLYNQRTAVKSI
jgi:hypothetical protein